MTASPATLSEPTLPYAGTSGHSGSATSRIRAARRDRPGGKTQTQQTYALTEVSRLGTTGLTVRELREDPRFADHHGSASGVLSNLHKSGHLTRLTEKRDGCSLYVLPMHVNGRTTIAHGRRKKDEPPARTDACTCACTCPAGLTVATADAA